MPPTRLDNKGLHLAYLLKSLTCSLTLFEASCHIMNCLIRRSYNNLDSILKSRDITLPKNFHPVKAMVFPVVMYECENWIIKKKLSTKELILLNCGVGEDS